MIGLLGVTTLVLVAGPPWELRAAAGGTNLKPPQNVEVSIIDDTFILQWDGRSSPGRNVTFSAGYQTLEMNNWMELPGCQCVASTNCDFSSLNTNVYDKVKLRIRAEEGNNTSPWQELDWFIPYLKAQIGPPKVRLEAEDKAIIINISPPGTKDNGMWDMDKSSFRYRITFWEDASGRQTTVETAYPKYLITDLSPTTTYCLKVKARIFLLKKHAVDSPVYCVNTTVENVDKLPPPENVRVSGENQSYVIQWNYTHKNVTFQAQWLPAFFKKRPADYEAKWTLVPGCDGARAAQCVFPQSTLQKGTYFFRVRASSGNSTSSWSREKEFDTESQTVLLPPVVIMKAVNSSSLRVFIGSQNKSAHQHYLLTYEIIFWENTSNAERKIVENRTDFTLPNLEALTMYCIKARALLKAKKWNNSSEFSETTCERTKPGSSHRAWLAAVLCVMLAAPLLLLTLWGLRRLVNYVFFPSSVPPSTIDEYISEQSLKNILLSTSEEQTERCFIIENGDTIATIKETNQTEDHKTYNSQTSQDSGNYSNEDADNVSRASNGFGQEDSVWQG
ncbi:interferon alpha/beta receptor 1 [Pteronotus mesoamericanus]|uniref:interferon alpha/beta receptor 1 n=1 Tax=Pteronotus mesoamericanus TaxID=1884717 RepID=UPI0023ECB679|nr:interferon alpha/beta receptor 1 [Pteronotus parnellii mesoamericanus]